MHCNEQKLQLSVQALLKFKVLNEFFVFLVSMFSYWV